MKILMVLSLLFCTNLAFAKNYNCEYEAEGNIEKIGVSINGKSADVQLRGKDYKQCKVDKDEFGQLVDCNALGLDLMVLINDNQEVSSGGIMSSTFDLFVDLDC